MSHKAPPEFKKVFSKDELDEAYKTFQVFDEDGSGDISSAELGSVLSKLGEDAKPARLRKLIADVDKDGDGTVNFGEFLHVYAGIKKSNKRGGGARGASAGRGSSRGSRSGRGSRGSKSGGGKGIAGASSAFGGIVARAEKEITRLGGATTDTSHSFSDEEKVAFVDHINMVLRSDPDLKDRLPINSGNMDLFKVVKDGLIINKLINDAVPDTVDERVLNKKKLNTFKIHENQVLAVKSAQAIGCNVTNIGAEDLINGTPHLVLGLLWQIIKIGLFAQINLVNHPELYRLLEPGETIDDLLALPIEQILIRWVNYHLKAAGSQKRIRNFGGDIKDSEAYTILLNQIAPKVCDKAPLKQGDLTKRAEMVLQRADKLDCRKFVTPKDIVKGNTKLNLAFVANLFNTHPALEPVEVPELDELDIIETREEKTFRNWMNSLGVDPFVTNLYHDLRSGVILLQLFKIIEPGSVEDSKVNWNPTSPFKKVENCNYAVAIGKSLNFSLVGIQGKDIVDGNKTLTLALVWQMMRHHVLSILKRLSKDGKAVGDEDILKWARKTLKANQPNLNTPLKGTKIGSFKDGSLKNGLVLIALLESIQQGAVDYSVISKSNNMGNAKYCISLARKLGATVFALPEDIVEVKGKMIMTLVASIMAVGLGK